MINDNMMRNIAQVSNANNVLIGNPHKQFNMITNHLGIEQMITNGNK